MQEMYVRRIRDLREDHDKTQQEIADMLGTSQTMYARYERGANELPIRHLIRLAKYYDVSTDYLLGIEGGPVLRTDGLTEKQIAVIQDVIDHMRKDKE